MIGDFGERNANHFVDVTEHPDLKKWDEIRSVKERVAEDLLKQVGAKLETHNVLLLVDLQGIYMNLHEWLRSRDFPIEGGLILSRLAFFLIYNAFERIKDQHLKSSEGPYSDFEELLARVREAGPGGTVPVNPKSQFVKFIPQFELYYAPSPLKQIEWQLRSQKTKGGGFEVHDQLSLIRSGVVRHKFFERNYLVYDDFIRKLKANPEYSKSAEGFYSTYVGPKGLKTFDEKEVDTRITIRAMDACYNYEADSLCIVSSDQDFLPLHERTREFGIKSYHADLAKFRPEDKTARKIKELGSAFIDGQIKDEWPLRIIVEASSQPEKGVPAMYAVTPGELSALCEMHNSLNDYHLSPNFLPDGSVSSLTMSKPAK